MKSILEIILNDSIRAALLQPLPRGGSLSILAAPEPALAALMVRKPKAHRHNWRPMCCLARGAIGGSALLYWLKFGERRRISPGKSSANE
jgi:hypothetical protein